MSEETIERRACPRCGQAMNRQATLCGYCWLRVTPLGTGDVEPAVGSVARAAPRPRWWRLLMGISGPVETGGR
jgi:hypothetical protein